MDERFIELEQRDLDRQFTIGVKAIAAYKGLSMAQLAKRAGVTHAALSYVYNGYVAKGSDKASHWTFPMLIKVSHALGVTVGELITASLCGNEQTPEAMVLRCAVEDTAPHSSERLQKIIRVMRGYDARTGVDSVGEAFTTLTSHYAEMGCPTFCDAYYSGKLDDIEASKIVAATLKEVNAETGEHLLFPFALDRVVKNH